MYPSTETGVVMPGEMGVAVAGQQPQQQDNNMLFCGEKKNGITARKMTFSEQFMPLFLPVMSDSMMEARGCYTHSWGQFSQNRSTKLPVFQQLFSS